MVMTPFQIYKGRRRQTALHSGHTGDFNPSHLHLLPVRSSSESLYRHRLGQLRLRTMPRGVSLLAAVLVISCIAIDASEDAPISFASVPTSSDVAPTDVPKLATCIIDCAANPANILAPFVGCTWGSSSSSQGGCVVDKSCFLRCFQANNKGAIYTNRYNLERTSFVIDETLTPSKVSPTTVSLKGSWDVDGAVYAQPLYAPHVRVAKGVYKNIMIIATEFNSVYGFDTDTREQLWKTSLTIGRVVEANDIPAVPSRPGGACTDISPYYGITSTPVIDPETNTVYVMSNSIEGAGVFSAQYRLSALNIATGAHREGSPTAPVAGSRTFPDSDFPNNATTFVAIKQLQRPGLALYKGLVYAAFGSHCDRPPYWPWIFAFEAKSLAISSFWTTPSFISRFNQTNPLFGPVFGGGPTIWMGGTAPSFYEDHLYVVTGRGPVNPPKQGYGNGILKLPLDLSKVEDFFIPANGVFLDNNDLDLGASGAIIMADKQLVITGGKQGPIYLAKALNLGGYDPAANNTNVFEVINPAPLNSTNNMANTDYSGPAYWTANGGQVFYRGRRTSRTGATLFRYGFDASGKLPAQPTVQAKDLVGVFNNRASNPVIQAAAADSTEAILWEIDEQSSLFAWDAMSLKLLYSTNNTNVCGGTRSSSGGVVKFALPTITGGKVYMGCGDKVLTYGLN